MQGIRLGGGNRVGDAAMMQLVALTIGASRPGISCTHHRAAHQIGAGIRFGLAKSDEVLEWGPEQRFPVARGVDVSCQRDDAEITGSPKARARQAV